MIRSGVWFEASGCAAALLAVLALLGCQHQRWQAVETVRAPDNDVAAALGDTVHQNPELMSAEQVPTIGYPQTLRPCCAFGANLKVKVGAVPVPGVDLGNVVGPDEVGPHRYDNGFISFSMSDSRGLVDNENNGLVYTCRGGFVDLAHVRDNADNTLALSPAAGRLMDAGGTFEVPPQGADMRVRFRPVPAELIEEHGRVQLAVAIGKWLAYQFSIWHEIATFYGYASIASWPEKISAFSPEDLYSNQLGARMAGAIILSGGAQSDQEYGLSMDAWIKAMLRRLRAVSKEETRAAAQAVDGAWWDSSKRVPDWELVTRRQFVTGPQIRPRVLEDATPGTAGPVEPLAVCRDAGPPLVLRVADGFDGVTFRDYATVEFDVHDKLAKAGFPFPRRGSNRITQDDFPGIVEKTRAATVAAMGKGADGP